MPAVRIRYQTITIDNFDIHVRSLWDKQQYADDLGEAQSLGISSAQWPLFGVVWLSGEVLAHEMADFPIAGKRILEVGCGMALSSLLLNLRHADITATDIHPEVGAFLAENTRLNNGAKIPFLRTGWDNSSDGLGKYDVIIGSDVLYEPDHIELLSHFIDRHASASCEIILVDPGRANHASFSKNMVARGYIHTKSKPVNEAVLAAGFKGHILRYQRQ
ncbi:methyltransferase [Oceanicoccus sp. KOV_DT_Chl]|uniref:class I SAM-dependent methyltransferase n=1 Tax=Oceanicoccus sp. KOV_DT_Chl TaxID=1904639 RepID=UPI000C7A2FCB|nr:histidine kinase [Oceanicoccus sp. KOV_DT_Chl]